MILNTERYHGPCACGKEHRLTTRLCVIEPGCLAALDDLLGQCGLTGRCAALYDEHTYCAQGLIRPKADKEIVLPADGLHADNHGVALALEQIPPDCAFLLAVGSGTIHDITRYCAHKLGLPFVSCPTAASVDGFCSSVAAMTWDGFKKTWTAVAPVLVVADINVIAQAPLFLTRSGFGDMVGKFVALAEWKLGELLLGEYLCPKIYQMTLEATQAVVDSVGQIRAGDPGAYEKLMYGLLLSGLAMQMLGSSRCASGGEHHISHFIEMRPAVLGVDSQALHGEKVGVGTLLAAREYHRLARQPQIPWRDYPPVSLEEVRKIFGPALYPSVAEENRQDCAAGLTAQVLAEKWPQICQIIHQIPTPQALEEMYAVLGVKCALPQIQVPEETLETLLDGSPLVRNRLTLMRLRRAMAPE